MTKRLHVGYRIATALIIVLAIASQVRSESKVAGWSAVNYISHFTILSSIFAAALLMALAAAPQRHLDCLRGAAVVYMLTTGVVFNLFLSDTHARSAWTSLALHVVAPALVVADWLVAPPAHQLSLRTAAAWAIGFPSVYLTYTLARGSLAEWYPYYFLDPRAPHSYLYVAAWCVAIGTGIMLVGIAVVKANHASSLVRAFPVIRARRR